MLVLNWRSVYVAGPKQSYRDPRFDEAVDLARSLTADLAGPTQVIDARGQFSSNDDWREKWPGMVAGIDGVVFIADQDGYIGRGVLREIEDVRAKGGPDPRVLFAHEGKLWAQFEIGPANDLNWRQHATVTSWWDEAVGHWPGDDLPAAKRLPKIDVEIRPAAIEAQLALLSPKAGDVLVLTLCDGEIGGIEVLAQGQPAGVQFVVLPAGATLAVLDDAMLAAAGLQRICTTAGCLTCKAEADRGRCRSNQSSDVAEGVGGEIGPDDGRTVQEIQDCDDLGDSFLA
jgi:hypothetical protein